MTSTSRKSNKAGRIRPPQKIFSKKRNCSASEDHYHAGASANAPADKKSREELLQPLTVQFEVGSCPPLFTNPEEPDLPSDGSGCRLQAFAQLTVTGDTEVSLEEGESAELQYGAQTFAVSVPWARLGIECVDKDEMQRYNLVIAQQE